MATIERRNIPPVNPLARIGEADKSKVYDIIRKHLADVLAGARSYYPDGVQRDQRTRLGDLNDFISSVGSLQQHVDDPSDVLGEVINNLREFSRQLGTGIDEREPVDGIEIAPHLSPTTEDNNVIHADPDGGYFSPPSPLSPSRRPRERKVSVHSSPEAISRARAFGLVSGRPMPSRIVQPPIFFQNG